MSKQLRAGCRCLKSHRVLIIVFNCGCSVSSSPPSVGRSSRPVERGSVPNVLGSFSFCPTDSLNQTSLSSPALGFWNSNAIYRHLSRLHMGASCDRGTTEVNKNDLKPLRTSKRQQNLELVDLTSVAYVVHRFLEQNKSLPQLVISRDERRMNPANYLCTRICAINRHGVPLA